MSALWLHRAGDRNHDARVRLGLRVRNRPPSAGRSVLQLGLVAAAIALVLASRAARAQGATASSHTDRARSRGGAEGIFVTIYSSAMWHVLACATISSL